MRTLDCPLPRRFVHPVGIANAKYSIFIQNARVIIVNKNTFLFHYVFIHSPFVASKTNTDHTFRFSVTAFPVGMAFVMALVFWRSAMLGQCPILRRWLCCLSNQPHHQCHQIICGRTQFNDIFVPRLKVFHSHLVLLLFFICFYWLDLVRITLIVPLQL